MKFSERLKLANLADDWCKALGIPASPINVVAALSDLGYLGEKRGEFAIRADSVCVSPAGQFTRHWFGSNKNCQRCGQPRKTRVEG